MISVKGFCFLYHRLYEPGVCISTSTCVQKYKLHALTLNHQLEKKSILTHFIVNRLDLNDLTVNNLTG